MINIISKELYFTGGVKLHNPHSISIHPGLTVVWGPNGSGKSTLGNIVERGWNFRSNHLEASHGKPRIKKIEFNDIHSLASDVVCYYQQRYESTMNDSVPAISEIIGERISSPRWKEYSRLLSIEGLEDRRVNFLSSGQLRKFLIANALLEDIDLLILDNPYIGLDSASRQVLNQALPPLVASGVNIMLLASNARDIPEDTTTLIPVSDMCISQPIYLGDEIVAKVPEIPSEKPRIDEAKAAPDESPVLSMRHCSVVFGGVKIFEDMDWEIRRGENWWLSGPNGSGKSTLLSLVNADNPQAYSNDISLFGRRRGTGESIWDIKRRISYISPESTLHARWNGTVEKVVAQGLTDTPFQPISPELYDEARRWLKRMHIGHLAQRTFSTLSAGERQMVLLARALVKQPELMILDEPFHGLDVANAQLVRKLITEYASDPSHTLIIVSHYDEELPPLNYKHKDLAKNAK